MKKQRALLICLFLTCFVACGGGEKQSSITINIPTPIAKAAPPEDISSSIEYYVAFSELFNLIKYYYPGDEAAATDWESFAIVGMRRIDQMQSTESIESILIDLFKPIAPSLEINNQVLVAMQPDSPSGYTFWHHNGFGYGFQIGGKTSIYSNSRMHVSSPIGSEFFPNPLYHEQTLTGGIQVRFPTAIATTNSATQPAASGFNLDESVERLNRSFNDRYVRLAASAITWGVIQHFFPYKDQPDLDWEDELPAVLLNSAMAANLADEIKVLQRMTATLHDGHVSYTPGYSSYARGVRPFKIDWAEGKAVVTDSWDGASELIKPGYVLTHIDNQPVEQLLTEIETYQSRGVANKRFESVYLLTLVSKQSSLYQFTDLDGNAVEYILSLSNDWERHFNGYRLVKEPNESVFEVAPDIFYWNLIDWVEGESDETQILQQLSVAKGVIIDWRGYPTNDFVFGLLANFCADEVSSPPFLIKSPQQPNMLNPIVSDGGWSLVPRLPQMMGKVAVITGRNTQSAADTGAALFQSCSNATLVGEATTGANGNITGFQLFGGPDNGGLQITFSGMEVLQNDGSQLIGIGVQPDVPVSITRQGIIDGVDESLEKAIELLQ